MRYNEVQSLTHSSVSEINLQNIFDSNYDIYEIHISDLDASASNDHMRMKLYNSSNAVITDAVYSNSYISMRSGNDTSWDYAIGQEGQTSFYLGYYGGNPDGSMVKIKIFNPYSSSLKFSSYALLTGWATDLSDNRFLPGGQYLTVTESVTGIQLYQGSATFSCNSKVYGIK